MENDDPHLCPNSTIRFSSNQSPNHRPVHPHRHIEPRKTSTQRHDRFSDVFPPCPGDVRGAMPLFISIDTVDTVGRIVWPSISPASGSLRKTPRSSSHADPCHAIRRRRCRCPRASPNRTALSPVIAFGHPSQPLKVPSRKIRQPRISPEVTKETSVWP